MTIEHVRDIRLVNLLSIATTIESLPNAAFKDGASKKMLTDMLLSETDGATKYAKTDDVKTMLKILKEIRSRIDGSTGNNREDDLIIDANSQRDLFKNLDNVIAAYDT